MASKRMYYIVVNEHRHGTGYDMDSHRARFLDSRGEGLVVNTSMSATDSITREELETGQKGERTGSSSASVLPRDFLVGKPHRAPSSHATDASRLVLHSVPPAITSIVDSTHSLYSTHRPTLVLAPDLPPRPTRLAHASRSRRQLSSPPLWTSCTLHNTRRSG